MYFPHGLNATEVTIEECPFSFYKDFPDSFSHIPIDASANMKFINSKNII
jgi:hypothetical protein